MAWRKPSTILDALMPFWGGSGAICTPRPSAETVTSVTGPEVGMSVQAPSSSVRVAATSLVRALRGLIAGPSGSPGPPG